MDRPLIATGMKGKSISSSNGTPTSLSCRNIESINPLSTVGDQRKQGYDFTATPLILINNFAIIVKSLTYHNNDLCSGRRRSGISFHAAFNHCSPALASLGVSSRDSTGSMGSKLVTSDPWMLGDAGIEHKGFNALICLLNHELNFPAFPIGGNQKI